MQKQDYMNDASTHSIFELECALTYRTYQFSEPTQLDTFRQVLLMHPDQVITQTKLMLQKE